MTERWRTGRKVGRTIYMQTGPEPSDEDILIGMMDTASLAQDAVDAVNASTAMQFATGELSVEAYSGDDNPVTEGPRGIRMTHLPSGFTTACHSERSQLMNKVRCIEEIRAALLAGVPGATR